MNNPRILVVDDRPSHVVPLVDLLKIRRWSVDLVVDGTKALEAVKKASYDVILLDLVLPRISGFEVLRQLKAATATSAIPVVVITAMVGGDDAASARLYGADYVLYKPFQLTKAMEVINRCLQIKRGESLPDAAMRTNRVVRSR